MESTSWRALAASTSNALGASPQSTSAPELSSSTIRRASAPIRTRLPGARANVRKKLGTDSRALSNPDTGCTNLPTIVGLSLPVLTLLTGRTLAVVRSTPSSTKTNRDATTPRTYRAAKNITKNLCKTEKKL